MEFASIAIKIVAGLVALLFVTRIIGKKGLAQMTPFDFVYAILLSSFVEEAVYDKEHSIWEMLFAVALWGTLIFTIEVLTTRVDFLRIALKGEPAILMEDGKINEELLRKNHLEMEQLQTMIRMKGVFSFKEVKDLVLEPDGSLSVNRYAKYEPVSAQDAGISAEDESLTFLLIDNGKLNYNILKERGLTEQWVLDQIEREGAGPLHAILYAEWSQSDGFHFYHRTEERS